MEKKPVIMGRLETLLGLFYIFIHTIVLPTVLLESLEHGVLHRLNFNIAQANFVAFALNFIIVTVLFNRFLLSSLRHFFNNLGGCLRICGTAFIAQWICSIVINVLISLLNPNFSNVNDASISSISQQNYTLILLGTSFLVPVVEETLYRGAIFGRLMQVNVILAYIVSIVSFSAIHVVGYIGLYSPQQLLLCFVQYFPAAFFLAWAYRKSGTIWTPILIHMIVNLIGITAMK